MEKHWLIPSICILLGLCIVAACMDDSLSPPSTNSKPTAAEYLRRQIEQKSLSLPDARIKDGKQTRSSVSINYDATDFTIDWKHYQALNDKENRIWMFPLRPSSPIAGSVYARSGETVKKRSSPATFKLMVRKFGKKGVSRIVTYIPEQKYLRNNRNVKVEDLGWDLRGTNYSGLVLNSHLNGELVFGLKYEKGRIVYRFAPHRDTDETTGEMHKDNRASSHVHLSFSLHSSKSTRGAYSNGEHEIDYCAGCGRPEDMCICFDFTCSFCGQPVDNCTCLTSLPEPNPNPDPEPEPDMHCSTCGFYNCICCSECHSYPCVCDWGGDGTDTDEDDYEDPDPNIGSGGGDHNSQPVKYIAKNGDKVIKKNLPQTMSKQLINSCVTSIMEYADNKIFNGNTNEGVYLEFYLRNYGDWITNAGVPLSNLTNFVGHYFDTRPFVSYQNAIDNGFSVMTDIPTSEKGSAHNVLVVGYQNNGDLIYMDPELGYWCTAKESYFKKDYNIVLTKTK